MALSLLASSEQDVLATYVVYMYISELGETARLQMLASPSPLVQLHMDGVLHALDRESRDHSH